MVCCSSSLLAFTGAFTHDFSVSVWIRAILSVFDLLVIAKMFRRNLSSGVRSGVRVVLIVRSVLIRRGW
jgi:hypothetical protein